MWYGKFCTCFLFLGRMGFRQNILMTVMMLLEVAVDILGKPVLTARVWTVSLTRPLHGKGLGGGGAH